MRLLSAPLVRLLLVTVACGLGRSGLRRCRLGGLACLARDRAQGPVVPRSRAHAKARSREALMRKGQFFRQSHRAASVEPLAGKGHLVPRPMSARQVLLPDKRSGSGGQSGLGVRCAFFWQGQSSWAQNLESNAFGSLLLLADNYNHTTNDPTTEAQSAQRTHRDYLAERSDAVLRLGDSCGPPTAAPGSRMAALLRRSGPGCCLWPPPVSRGLSRLMLPFVRLAHMRSRE